ncbi:MAG: ribbon-helix-helix protein, CopG family [Chloroflexi bacterium]|nr:ribbon-helix-helix protein, CopG family [Chloroflexota bacterium]MYE40989.1 ribbon-helix-helix protein, CopG family [Chloroflexota bacterium]
MKKITISLDDETHRRAKEWAAKRGMSVSAMVRDYLASLTDSDGDVEYLASTGKEESEKTLDEVIEAIFARGGGIDPRENLTREELHDRNAFR